MSSIWKIRIDEPEGTLIAARRHLTTVGRSRVELRPAGGGPTLSGVVVDSGRPPSLPHIPVGPPAHDDPAALHPGELPPQARWVVVVDDTGSTWTGPSPEGRLVALVLGEGATLPQLPRFFHATQDPQTAAKALEHLARGPAGVLGLRAAMVPDLGTEERWRIALIALLERVILLLPTAQRATPRGLADDRTTAEHPQVDVIVEQHAGVGAGDHTGALVEAVLLGVRRARGGAHPGVRLRINVVSKGQHPATALADALAWAWSGVSTTDLDVVRAYRERGLLPTTHAHDAVVDAVPAVLGGSEFDPQLWRRLCRWAADAPTPGLAHALRARFEARVAATPGWLDAAVDANQALLYSRRFDATDLRLDAESLGRMGRPRGAEPEVTLGVAAATLADQNRRGQLLSPQQADALRAEAHGLLDELPAAAAEVCLRLAVAHTNALDWDAAEAALPPDTAPLPLLWRGRVASARGQVAANRGNAQEAEQQFDAAQAFFTRLRSSGASAEARQTAAYRLANRWALPPTSPATERLAIGARADLARAALTVVFASAEPTAAWTQLDLLRWMAARPAQTAAEREALFDAADTWHTAPGHPWPLIGLYRVVVLRAADAVPDSLVETLDHCVALATAPGAGPAVQLIAHAAEVHRLALLGVRDSDRLDALRATLRVRLPRASAQLAAGEARLAAGQVWTGGEWLAELLPFSFR
jgi:hypothetical protein